MNEVSIHPNTPKFVQIVYAGEPVELYALDSVGQVWELGYLYNAEGDAIPDTYGWRPTTMQRGGE